MIELNLLFLGQNSTFVKNEINKKHFKLDIETGFEPGFEIGFETDFETGFEIGFWN